MDQCDAFDLIGFSLSEEKDILLGAVLKCHVSTCQDSLQKSNYSESAVLGMSWRSDSATDGKSSRAAMVGFGICVLNFHILEITSCPILSIFIELSTGVVSVNSCIIFLYKSIHFLLNT